MIFVTILSVGLLLLWLNHDDGTSNDQGDLKKVEEKVAPAPKPEIREYPSHIPFEEIFPIARIELGEGQVFKWNGMLYTTDWENFNQDKEQE
tara:strand:- start:446 stop:721 length:276 start_codon:yes stop_codon:yes gene_type:complete